MGKIIAVCGSPSSGKTTVGLKIAQELYFKKKKPVFFLSPDWNKPTLSYLFPRRKESDLFSLGAVMDHTAITQEELLKHTVCTEQMKDFGFLGLKTGENRLSYPVPTEDKVLGLFRVAKELAAYFCQHMMIPKVLLHGNEFFFIFGVTLDTADNYLVFGITVQTTIIYPINIGDRHVMPSLNFVMHGNRFFSISPPQVFCVVIGGFDF